jgi:hypothetical protein
VAVVVGDAVGESLVVGIGTGVGEGDAVVVGAGVEEVLELAENVPLYAK